ncbi:transcription factor [Angomonas deanei]|nr:transcription factor [Angomonas deanei]EPY42368.1 transcription factor [Angomonas deanei]|eukprot:EPY38516.1 transcription factor [Angomonas deanei]
MSSKAHPSGQDWEPQVYNVHKKNTSGTQRKVNEHDANKAIQSGQAVAVQRKEHLKMNQQAASAGANAKKLDEDHETLKVKKIDPQVRMRIQRARQELNWTQADLAQKISERVTVVTEYENGKAVPEERILVKMEKAFGIYLRGAKAGQEFGKVRPTPKPAQD